MRLWLLVCVCIAQCHCHEWTKDAIKNYRDRAKAMFEHAYEGYLRHAFPYDELRPLSCDGADTWGGFSLTLVDALDTLAVMGNQSEFHRVVQLLSRGINFDRDVNVSVFETNIRVVGGLLSAHLLSQRMGMELEPDWPYEGPLLRMAHNLAQRLLPAFSTKSGMPYGTVNLLYGVPEGETTVTCTAGVGTFLLEFGTLSRLTGDTSLEEAARRALDALWKSRSPIGLVGNHVDVQTGQWTALDAGIGAGVDSYYEYLVKGSLLFQEPTLMNMFQGYLNVINKYVRRDDWHPWVSMGSGQVTLPVFQSLEAFWPGLLSLVGDLEAARKSLYNYYQVWRQYGFTPEFYDVGHFRASAKREGYPLRPELVESIMYLYQATGDKHFLDMGADIMESIQHSARTLCGYATVKNVFDHQLEDRMESFFLAETTKYLYLLFSPDHYLHGSIFNTEAHPIDPSVVLQKLKMPSINLDHLLLPEPGQPVEGMTLKGHHEEGTLSCPARPFVAARLAFCGQMFHGPQ
ncbi:ER degradation-enhancing alpha-mannosidase-like protein 2 isoform X2 [Ornithodoros turicata]|uniref:ER degradation-enhancing alpha-mannosidase-like protein 2 isoform X2 n=1 Tax=Ornithodoros turicata TaxID=34597 RepID=UPI00313A46A4